MRRLLWRRVAAFVLGAVVALGVTGATALEFPLTVTKRDQISGDTWVYSYNQFGVLDRVSLPDGTEIVYLLDALQRRAGKVKNGVVEFKLLWLDDLRPIAELDENNTPYSLFVYADKPNIPEYLIQNGQNYRVITDHLGSLRLVVNASTGEIVQRMLHDEHGNVLEDWVDPSFHRVPFGWAGGLYDPDTGLVRFGARDYDPEIGRWTAPDPIGFAGGDGNLYAYARNDHVNRRDVNGESVSDCVVGFGDGASFGLTVEGRLGTGVEQAVDMATTEWAVCAGLGFVTSGAIVGTAVAGTASFLGLLPSTATATTATVATAPTVTQRLSNAGNALLRANPTGSALKPDLYHRSATWMREAAAKSGSHFPYVGKDGATRTLTQIPGVLNDVAGRFEYIVDPAGRLTHQMFVSGGTINGIPIVP